MIPSVQRSGVEAPAVEMPVESYLPAMSEGELPDALLMLGERAAVRRYFDDINARRLNLILWALVAVAAGYGIEGFAEGRPLRAVVALALGLVDLLLVRARRSPFLTANVRQVVASVLIGHFFILNLFHFDSSGGVVMWFLLFPIMAARFRLAEGEILALFGSLLAVLVLRLTVEVVLTKQGVPLGQLVGYGTWFAVVCLVAWRQTRRQEARFLVHWRRETGRQRERLRMKQELEYAREIQLSMLPREAPRFDGLDMAALSLPATEVGGDYYDYFSLGDGRLAIVIGDVTGHGVASGLVLSGVRSSLNLLSDDLDRPAEVLDRLNRMLKRTSTPRMLMTLGVAVLDRTRGEVTVASAGHPPALLVRQHRGDVVEVGRGALPLGAMETAEYVSESAAIESGDVLLLYSDGLVEAVDASGREYGYPRLADLLRREAAGRPNARAIRDAVLRDVWEHKGEVEQADDVTMVVIRVDGMQTGQAEICAEPEGLQ